MNPRARKRAVERLKPGYWWLGDFDSGDTWVHLDYIIETEQISTGHRLVRLYGTDPSETGDRRHVELVNLRGHSVLSLTETQARRCGLSLTEPDR